jgi:flagellar basal body-associated protein FliL
MPGAGKAEVYFIVSMMVLILIFAFGASYIFFRQYRKEMREKRENSEKADTNGNGKSDV